MEETNIQEEKIGITTTGKDISRSDLEKKYEDLKKFTNDLIEKMNSLKTQELRMQDDRNMYMMYKRMEYLFQIIDRSEKFPEDFVKKCIEEVIQVLNFEDNAAE